MCGSFHLFQFTFFFFILVLSQNISAITPAWTTSPYLQAGSKKVIDSFLCNCVATNTSVPNATVAFASAFSSAPNVAYGLANYEGRDGIFSEGFEIRLLSKTQSSLSLSVTISLITNILSLEVRYLAIDRQFPYHINAFANLPVNYLKGALVNLTTSSLTNHSYTNLVNYTAQCQQANYSYNRFSIPLQNNKLVLFMNAFVQKALDDSGDTNGNANDDDSNDGNNNDGEAVASLVPITLVVNATVLSQENYQIKVVHGIRASITKLHFSMIIYDQNNIQSSGNLFTISDRVCYTKIGGFYSLPSQFIDNFIIGFIQFTSKRTFALISFQNMFSTINGTFGVQMPPSYINGTASGYDSIYTYCFSIFYVKKFACPIKTYFQPSVGECLVCSINCLSCENISGIVQCQICNASALYFLNPSTFQCEVCLIPNCLECSNFSSCSVCSSDGDYFLNQTTLLCDACTLPYCITCASLTSCQVCNETDGTIVKNLLTLKCQVYTPSGGQSCSNNILEATEECDDGNSANGDGCSDLCLIQEDFSCQASTTPGQRNSMCFYSGEISLYVKEIQKADDSNKISITLDIFPKQMSIWNDLDFQEMISISGIEGWQDFEVSRNSDGTLLLLLSYNYNIHNKSITVQLDPKRSGRLSLSRAFSATRSFQIVPSDNQNAQFYTPNTYGIAKITGILAYIIVGLSYFLFILGILSGKLIGIEAMAVVQIASVSLITLSSINPCFKSLSNLMLANGVNYFHFQQNYPLDPFLPSSIRGLKLNSQFMKNMNINFLFILLLYLLSAVFAILTKTVFRSNKSAISKLRTASLKCFFLAAFNIILLSGYSAGIFISLQFRYAMSSFSEAIQIASLIETISIMILFGIYFFLLVKYPKNFGQFTIMFNKTSDLTKDQSVQEDDQSNFILGIIKQKWYNILLVERILVGVGLGLLTQTKFSLAYPICIAILLIILTIFLKHYRYPRHNYRSIANHLTVIVILLIYLIYQVIPLQKQTQVWLFLPLFVCILLIFCILHNLVMLVYELMVERKGSDMLKTQTASSNRVQQKNLNNKTQVQLMGKGNYYEINKKIKMEVQMLQRTETLADFKDWGALSNQLKTEQIEEIQMV